MQCKKYPPIIMSERLKLVVDESGLSRRDFAKRIGIGRTSLMNCLSGNQFINGFALMRISATFHVSADWLLGITDKREVG